MRTPLRRFGIPACAAVLAFTAALTSCSDDSSDSTDTSATTTVSVATPVTEGDPTTTAAPASTVPLPPDDTTDIPLPPPPGTGDIPVVLPPETSDVPVYLSVTIGTDDSPSRVDNVPLGAQVTIDVVNLEGSDEYHLQGYELGAGEVMGPGQTYTFAFVANQAGDFILESISSGAVLLTLHVG